MFKTSIQKPNINWEPIELRLLKRQLASISCKCTVCERNRFFQNHIKSGKCEKEVQVKLLKTLCLEQSTQMYPCLLPEIMTNFFGIEGFCSNCLLAMNILARRQRQTVKDEETVTDLQIYCNKCMCKCGRSTEQTISTNNSLQRKLSILTVNDFASQCSSGTTPCRYVNEQRDVNDNMKLIGWMDKDGQSYKNYTYGNCMYLEDLVDSIRPPLK